MNLVIGVAVLLVGVGMVWAAAPKGNVSPAFMRNRFMQFLYPVVCLMVFVAGIGLILAGLPWSLL